MKSASVWASRMLTMLIAIPKKDTVFRIEMPRPTDEGGGGQMEEQHTQADPSKESEAPKEVRKMVFELNGSHFQNKATDRATRKFKTQRIALL